MPADVHPRWMAESLRHVEGAISLGRDLVHHPAITWLGEAAWPVCCDDYTVFYGHSLAAAGPRSQPIEDWFVESLVPELPEPSGTLDELESTYVFRCGYCGAWRTVYEALEMVSAR